MITIAHLSDLHLCSTPKEVIYGVNPYDNLLQTVHLLNSIDDIDVCIITGDISNDATKPSYELADTILSELSFPVFITPGNHDREEILSTVIFKKIRIIEFFSLKDIDFISVNTTVKGDDGLNRSRGMIDKKEIGKLISNLNKSNNPKIIYMHHPVTLTDSWLDRRIVINREEFIDCISSAKKVLAVLAGHNHYYTNCQINNCIYTTAPSVSTSYDKDLKPFEEANKPGFSIIRIDGEECNICRITTISKFL
ncbi:MAG: metallophosphoesterase [Bacteroidales bacterium]|nr:metallophosphoesterase [Bacteroidales bacterium]